MFRGQNLVRHHSYQRTLWCVALVLGCTLLMLWIATSARAQNLPIFPNIDAVLLIDNSGSMTTSDPDELRIHATQFLLGYLRTNATSQGANYRVSIANFGGRMGNTFSLQLLQDDSLQNSLHSERINGTEFVEPLKYAINELRQKSDPQTKKVVVLITDGQPGPEGRALEGEELQRYFDDKLAPLSQELKAMDAKLFVLAIGDARQDRQRWSALIGDSYRPVANIADLNDIFHEIFNTMMGLDPTQALELSSTGVAIPSPKS